MINPASGIERGGQFETRRGIITAFVKECSKKSAVDVSSAYGVQNTAFENNQPNRNKDAGDEDPLGPTPN